MKRSYKLLFVLIGVLCFTCFAPVAAFAASTDSYASGITTSSGAVYPHFAKTLYNYSATTAANATSVTIGVAKSNSHAKTYMRTSGHSYHPHSGYTVELAAGHSTYLYIKVLSQDKHRSHTYCVKVTRPQLYTGCSYKGGKIAYIDSTGQHGLIAATRDQSTRAYWTKAKSLCAHLVSGGYSDWRLPSIGELGKLYQSRRVIGGFASAVFYSDYWSSSVRNEYVSWIRDFSTNAPYGRPTENNARVRAVRSF